MPTRTSFDEVNALDAPFSKTDIAIRRSTLAIVRLFSRMRSRITQAGDLYAMMEIVYGTYSQAEEVYRNCLATAYEAAYRSAFPSGMPNTLAAVSAFLTAYITPEGYVPRAEWQRKRDRCFEAIASAIQAGTSVMDAIKTARNLLVGQVRQGADDMTTRAIADAYDSAGIKRVKYVTQRDSRVCEECKSFDGRVYYIDSRPALPRHYRCRCFYVPVKPSTDTA